MADESTAVVSQPSAAEESQQNETTRSDYSSFLGPPSAEADLSAPDRPAPDAEGEEAEPELSGEAETEGEPEQAQEAQTQEVELEAEPEVEQPASIEERLKDLTQREQEQYAQRYPNAWKMLQDRNTPDDVKHLLLDKIDGDHEIQRRIAEEQALVEQTEEPTLEEEPEQQQVQPDAAQQRTAYYEQIDHLVKNQFDQQAVKEVGDTLLRMFNVNVKALEDPNVSPEDKAVLQGLVQSVQREAPVLARFMADAVSTTVPFILPAAMEAAMPGFTQMYERQMYGTAYEAVRQQRDERGRPVYPGLPAYPMIQGTPEADAFAEKMRQAADEIPGFHEMVFRDRQGRVLPEQQQAQMKYTLLARHLSGQRVNPAVVAQAVETGRRLAGRADTRRQAARATGAGQGTGGLGRGGANEEEDPMMAALDAEIARQEGNYRQPIRGRQSGR